MSLFNQISQDDFIQNYWQQEPLVFSEAVSEYNNIVDGDELAGLACAEGVEARIIHGYDIDGDWACQDGPFSQETFASLDQCNWTLLVQGVDQWDDEIKSILDQFTFLPKWRLEDIMASYAPVGGGVGPHFDFYDVFLIQISGSREWQIGQHCDNTTVIQDNNQVKLLSNFVSKQTHTLHAGDMIYIPAGIAHWGTSLSDDCITFSVGFRAPSEKEIIVEALEGLIQYFEVAGENSEHYRDTSTSIDQHPHKINDDVQQQLTSSLAHLTPELLTQSINQAFGKLVTDPRYSPYDDDEEQHWSEAQLLDLFNTESTLAIQHSSNSRFAFSETQLFVNGEAFNVSPKFSQAICDKQLVKPESQAQTKILLSLLNQQFIKT